MERSSIYVKTQLLYEDRKKYMSIFEEMKWSVINGKLSDVFFLIYSFL